MEDRLDDGDLAIEDICLHLAVSRSQLHRIMIQSTGLSISLYIRQQKLEKAKELLQNSDLRISEICDAVGIGSPQNFSKYFGETYGESPTDFRKKHSEPRQNKLAIAVLPFVNLSNDRDQEYFSDGITDELISLFSQVGTMQVVGRSSSFSFKGKSEDVRAIGQALSVNYIIEGSVRRTENRLRINTQLINVTDGFQIWSGRFDREMADIFEIQEEISEAILEEIEVKLLGMESPSLVKSNTQNAEAYEFYLNGRFYHNKFAGPAEFYKSIAYYQKAIEIDPEYAQAYAGIASCFLNLWFYRLLDSKTGLLEIRNATQKAFELAPENPECLLAQARMELLCDWNLKAAEHTFRKSIAKGGSKFSDLHGQFALLCGMKGKVKMAKRYLDKALRLDPFSLFNNFYGAYVCWMCSDTEQAIQLGHKMLEMDANFWGGHAVLGLNLIRLGKADEAIKHLLMSKNFNTCGFTLSALGAVYGLSGNENKANETLNEMKDLLQKQPVSNYDFGIIYASIGDLDQAFVYFEKAIDLHEPSMLFFEFIVRDWLVLVKDDPRLVSIKKRISPL